MPRLGPHPRPLPHRGGGVGEGSTAPEGLANRREGGREISLYYIRGDAEKAEAEGFERGLALFVFLLLGFVNGAIDLDHEPLRRAVEVDHEGADRLLAAELTSVEALAAERFPQHRFTARGVRPQVARGVPHPLLPSAGHAPSLPRLIAGLVPDGLFSPPPPLPPCGGGAGGGGPAAA